MFAAAMLYSAPGVEISIYATCKRISQKLLRNVVKFFDLICKSDTKGTAFVGVRSNMEELVVRNTQDPTDVRIINSYPSKVSLVSCLLACLAHTHTKHKAEEKSGCNSRAAFFAFSAYVLKKTRGDRMTEPNEVFVTRPELMGSVRDVIARARLAESYKSLKAQGQISWSSRVKPVGAKDRAMIAQAYESAVDSEQLPAEDSDRALIAQAYRYLQETQQLPVPAQDVIMCVQSGDAVADFFEARGLANCKDQICNFMGIETAADLAILTAADVQGTRFKDWATYNLSIVQHRKMLNAFPQMLG
jgi:hypothetical protein